MATFPQFLTAGLVAGALLLGVGACGDSDTPTATVQSDSDCGVDGSCDTGDSGGGPRELIGSAAPEISGPNITGSGDTGLASYDNKPMAVVFWVNICPHCVETMPRVDDLQRELGSDVQILSVAIHDPAADGEGNEGFETPEDAAATMNLTIPTVVQERDQADGQWHLSHVPTVFILDSQHVIVDVIEPDPNGSDIVGPMEKALAAAE